ncbi:Tn3 family transposase [Massilia norwichensis]|uniref:Tn3 family transposase n=1 Tax=Massilia norwichensis TaxID=1442366 RepID=UPI00351CCC13
MCDRGLNLVTGAIVLWHAVFLERATQVARGPGSSSTPVCCSFVSSLAWEHIYGTGYYI